MSQNDPSKHTHMLHCATQGAAVAAYSVVFAINLISAMLAYPPLSMLLGINAGAFALRAAIPFPAAALCLVLANVNTGRLGRARICSLFTLSLIPLALCLSEPEMQGASIRYLYSAVFALASTMLFPAMFSCAAAGRTKRLIVKIVKAAVTVLIVAMSLASVAALIFGALATTVTFMYLLFPTAVVTAIYFASAQKSGCVNVGFLLSAVISTAGCAFFVIFRAYSLPSHTVLPSIMAITGILLQLVSLFVEFSRIGSDAKQNILKSF